MRPGAPEPYAAPGFLLTLAVAELLIALLVIAHLVMLHVHSAFRADGGALDPGQANLLRDGIETELSPGEHISRNVQHLIYHMRDLEEVIHLRR